MRPRSLANVAERPAVTSRSRPIRPREFGAARAFSPCRGHQDPGSSAATPTETPRASPSRRGRYRRPASPAAFLPRGELCAGQRLGTSGKKNEKVSGRENRVADAVASRGGDRRMGRAFFTRLVAAVGAAVGTTGTARIVHVSIKSFVPSRLARLALWLSRSRQSRWRLRLRRIPSQPRFGACPRPTARRSLAPT